MRTQVTLRMDYNFTDSTKMYIRLAQDDGQSGPGARPVVGVVELRAAHARFRTRSSGAPPP